MRAMLPAWSSSLTHGNEPCPPVPDDLGEEPEPGPAPMAVSPA